TLDAYLTAYFIKLQLMSKLAKTDDTNTSLRYFVEEQMVASPLLLIALAVMAFIGVGDVMNEFRLGLTTFLSSSGAMFALLVGFCYAGLCICTSLIFLDRRENTFCVPMHCGSSMLSGLTASYALAWFPNQSPPGGWQMASAGLIVIALALLSPLHHFEFYLGKLRYALAQMFPNLISSSQKEHSRAAIGLEPTVADVGFSTQMAAGADEFKKIGQI